jgi:hypothetical protein
MHDDDLLYQCPLARMTSSLDATGARQLRYELRFGDQDQRVRSQASSLRDRVAGAQSMFVAEAREVTPSCITWSVPSRNALVPLSSIAVPLRSSEVEAIVRSLASALQALHQVEIAAFDLAPAMVFVRPQSSELVLVPSPLADVQSRAATQPVSAMPFVAPEVLRRDTMEVDRARADVYALGALAWFLLTGTERGPAGGALPSQVDELLAGWDRFIDGSCRTNPGRRFAAPGDAVASLGAPLVSDAVSASAPAARRTAFPSGSVPGVRVPSANLPEARIELSRGRLRLPKWARIVAFLAGVAAVAVWLLEGLASDYARGGGGTILRYADRSYEGASWQKLEEFDALWSANERMSRQARRFGLIAAVAGWDDSNVWLALGGGGIGEHASVVALRDGHWVLQHDILDSKSRAFNWQARADISVFSPEVQSVAFGDLDCDLFLLAGGSRQRLGQPETNLDGAPIHVSVISEDLIWLSNGDEPTACVWSGNRFNELDRERDKSFYVHTQQNAPVRSLPAGAIRQSGLIGDERAVGIAAYQFPERGIAIVEHRNGIWYLVERVEAEDGRDLWLNADGGQLRSASFVGDGGRVCHWRSEGSVSEQTVSVPSAATSLKLLRIWGVNLDKYWVMDTNGTVWEWSEGQWREVVRGLYDEKVSFRDAWVSPTGTVFAVTHDSVYRLR